jgi:hypothetical protein
MESAVRTSIMLRAMQMGHIVHAAQSTDIAGKLKSIAWYRMATKMVTPNQQLALPKFVHDASK